MAQKRKPNQSKLAVTAALLKKLEEQTARKVKTRLDGSWRDNLFEILMTRMELAAPDKKIYTALPSLLRREPKEIPAFTKQFLKTMHNILKLAMAPAQPQHVATFSLLYLSILERFVVDDTKDHSKTMALLDQRLGWFEQFVEYTKCSKSAGL